METTSFVFFVSLLSTSRNSQLTKSTQIRKGSNWILYFFSGAGAPIDLILQTQSKADDAFCANKINSLRSLSWFFHSFFFASTLLPLKIDYGNSTLSFFFLVIIFYFSLELTGYKDIHILTLTHIHYIYFISTYFSFLLILWERRRRRREMKQYRQNDIHTAHTVKKHKHWKSMGNHWKMQQYPQHSVSTHQPTMTTICFSLVRVFPLSFIPLFHTFFFLFSQCCISFVVDKSVVGYFFCRAHFSWAKWNGRAEKKVRTLKNFCLKLHHI